MGVVQQLPMLAVVFYSNFSSRNQGVCLLSFFEIFDMKNTYYREKLIKLVEVCFLVKTQNSKFWSA